MKLATDADEDIVEGGADVEQWGEKKVAKNWIDLISLTLLTLLYITYKKNEVMQKQANIER